MALININLVSNPQQKAALQSIADNMNSIAQRIQDLHTLSEPDFVAIFKGVADTATILNANI